jgi:hypothetical protein
MKSSLLLTLLLSPLLLGAQVYTEKKSQHRFAQTYVGVNAQYIPKGGSLVWQDHSQPFPSYTIPRFTIGGVHFWGKWDFNMNIPLTVLGSNLLEQGGYADFTSGADLSARYYPWALKFGKLRPFVGASFNTMQLDLGTSNDFERTEGFITASLVGGLSFMVNNWRINAEMMYLPFNKRGFYSNLTESHTFELPPYYFSLGIVHHFDFTLSEEKPKESGKTKAVEAELLKKGKLNSISLGVAPNGSYFAAFNPLEGKYASLSKHKGSFNWEFGLGYLFHKAKTHVGLTYRNYSSKSLSYDYLHIIRREALSLEAYRFLWNFNGFVPYAGISISGERWAAGIFENDNQVGETVRTQMISPGFIFGWDILPSPLETWVLRTNLRYYPMQEIRDIGNRKTRVDQFEFNFIQFVWYPNRWVHVRKAKKRYDQQHSL